METERHGTGTGTGNEVGQGWQGGRGIGTVLNYVFKVF